MHGAIFDKKKCKKCIMLKLVIDYGYCLDLLTISLENSRVYCTYQAMDNRLVAFFVE